MSELAGGALPDPADRATTPAGDDRGRINLSWLVRLRWGAVLGQTAMTVIAALGLGIDLALAPLLAIVAVEVASNLLLGVRLRRATPVVEAEIAATMALDVVLLTGLFHWSGGASNPFTPLYLVYIALAAVVLSSGWTWALVALALVCFGALFLAPRPDGISRALEDFHAMPRLHLEGMWVAFGVGAAFIVYFVQRVVSALDRRERELARAHAAQARAERLASLATLAAGAAHELSTPLATIAVVARELERELARRGDAAALRADVDLVRAQVERCREILVQMAADAGQSTGEDSSITPIARLIASSVDRLASTGRVVTSIDSACRDSAVVVPPRAVARALHALVKNALEASPEGDEVRVEASLDGNGLRVEVCDRGAGMAAEVLQRAGEPFFTTKPPGRGMGLGLFLARHVLERVGGTLELRSRMGEGTVAVVRLPGRQAGRHAPGTRAAA